MRWINEGLPTVWLVEYFPFFIAIHRRHSYPSDPPNISQELSSIRKWNLFAHTNINSSQLTKNIEKLSGNVWIMFTCAKSHHHYFLHPPTNPSPTLSRLLDSIAVRVKGVNHQINYNICSMSRVVLREGLIWCRRKFFAISKYRNSSFRVKQCRKNWNLLRIGLVGVIN